MGILPKSLYHAVGGIEGVAAAIDIDAVDLIQYCVGHGGLCCLCQTVEYSVEQAGIAQDMTQHIILIHCLLLLKALQRPDFGAGFPPLPAGRYRAFSARPTG